MKITRVEAVPFDLPVAKPLHFATGRVDVVRHVLVRVHTDDGVIGEAEAVPRSMTYGDTQSTVVSVIAELIEPRILGLDPLTVERVHERTAGIVANHSAKAAVDLAVHDLRGKVLGQPCHVLLGGYADSVRAAYMLSFGRPEEVAESARAVMARYGIDAFKIKVGAGLDQDVRTCTAVREAAGDRALLYIDANHGYDADGAARLMKTAAELDISWFEEPVPAADLLAGRRLARTAPVPIGGDERCRSLHETATEILGGSVSQVSIKTARTGFTESARILSLAAGLGVPVTVGSQFESGIGALAGISFAAAFRQTADRPVEATSFLDLSGDLLADPPVIENGRLHVPSAPGLGARVDEDRLRHFDARRRR